MIWNVEELLSDVELHGILSDCTIYLQMIYLKQQLDVFDGNIKCESVNTLLC